MSRKEEENNLLECISVIQQNINKYEKEEAVMSAEIKDMFVHYHSDNPDMYVQLANTSTMYEQVKLTLFKNKRALKKPYFGRIDYVELDNGKFSSLYLGKNGVMKSPTQITVVDWRAPIATVYYESQVGNCSFQGPNGEEQNLTLELKRTYEIDNGKLVDYYDSEVVANDDLLTKYLAKNKEAVLGEIIATIQKEQNDIIRQKPFHNVVVQGVAGSGKTTVAMHRISYILYNYGDKFRPNEFFIIGSNRILLNYITSVLPDLDVYHVNQMTMEAFYLWLLDEKFMEKKYKLIVRKEEESLKKKQFAEFKGSLDWSVELKQFCNEYEKQLISCKAVCYEDMVLYSEEAFHEFMASSERWSTQKKLEILNNKALVKIKNQFIGKDYEYETKEMKEIIKRYQNFYGSKKLKLALPAVYEEFALWLKERAEEKYQQAIDDWILVLKIQEYDIYDIASIIYLKSKLLMMEEMEDARHIVVDEAQDYGVMVFWVLKQILPRCTFTVMGDVSQNINYDSGMNDWEALKSEVFCEERDYFSVLAKSYRNTIEISDYAGTILNHCSFRTYPIVPLIRHGKGVETIEVASSQELLAVAVSKLNDWLNLGYDTIAVICRDEVEAKQVQCQLMAYLPVQESSLENAVFNKGIMVLPIKLTKGLEFDTVLLWNPVKENYKKSDANAKLLYVAVTRALHELTIVFQGVLSPLL
jgi:DNA helicase-2/ATP-dependent DNA helicase PcrA